MKSQICNNTMFPPFAFCSKYIRLKKAEKPKLSTLTPEKD